LGLLIGIGLTNFALQNLQFVEIRLLPWRLQSPRVLRVLGSVAAPPKNSNAGRFQSESIRAGQ
jgi:hypothetical protein